MLFATIIGLGCICRPSSSPICSPICSRLVAGPISTQHLLDGGRGPARVPDDAVETEAPAAPRPTDRPIPRAIEATIRVGAALPPAAYDAPIGVSPTGIPRKSASSATSTSICLAKGRIERIDRATTIERREARVPLSSSAPLERLSLPRRRSAGGPRGLSEFLALANPPATGLKRIRSTASRYHYYCDNNSERPRTPATVASLFARRRSRMVSGVTSSQVGLVDISTGLRRLGRQCETYDDRSSSYNLGNSRPSSANNETSFVVIAAQILGEFFVIS